MRLFTILIFAFFLGSVSLCSGQSEKKSKNPPSKKNIDTPIDTNPKFTPIELKNTGTEKKPEEHYIHDGVQLESLQQFKAVIDPLNDKQASDLLKSYAVKDSTGTVFIALGGTACVSGLIYAVAAAPQTQYENLGFGGTIPVTTNPDATPFYVLEAGGGVFLLTGLLFKSDADHCRNAAIHRYNEVIGPKQSLSIFLTPHSHLPAIEWALRF